jgi:hypothetical protein
LSSIPAGLERIDLERAAWWAAIAVAVVVIYRGRGCPPGTSRTVRGDCAAPIAGDGGWTGAGGAGGSW